MSPYVPVWSRCSNSFSIFCISKYTDPSWSTTETAKKSLSTDLGISDPIVSRTSFLSTKRKEEARWEYQDYLIKKSCCFCFCFPASLPLYLLSRHGHNFGPIWPTSTIFISHAWFVKMYKMDLKLKQALSKYLTLSASLRIRIRYCVIFVSLCLFLWTKNFGQYACKKPR